MATPVNPDGIDWSVATWEGARLQQMREFARLSFREKLEAIEELCDLAERLQKGRRADQQQEPGKGAGAGAGEGAG